MELTEEEGEVCVCARVGGGGLLEQATMVSYSSETQIHRGQFLFLSESGNVLCLAYSDHNPVFRCIV